MRARSSLLLVALAGCASGGGSSSMPVTTAGGPASTTSVVAGAMGSVGTDGTTDLGATRDNSGVVTAIPSPVDKVWTTLIATYGALSIEAANVDVQRRVYGNSNVQPKNGRIAGLPVAQLLNCGTSPLGAPLAQTYQVHLSVISSLAPSGAGTTLTTRVQGTAASRDGSSTRVTCGSTGRLEKRIAELTEQAAR